MPVDKFGRTDAASVERIVSGGVTLNQINNTFLRLDGSNDVTGDIDMGGRLLVGLPTTYPSAGNGDEAISFTQATALVGDKITNSADPTDDKHLTNKKYVDDQDASKVSKTGETMTGNLLFSVGTDRLRTTGCRSLSGNKEFAIFLGNTTNKILCRLTQPITLHTTDGFLVKHGDQDIIRFGSALGRRVTESFQDIVMNEKYIVGLHDPAEAQDAATKKYVDESLKKCHIGYIPTMTANDNVAGFFISASSETSNNKAYMAFNNSMGSEEGTWISGDGVTAWLQIKCPEPVIIWRIALEPLQTIPAWNLSASNDGVSFVPLFTSTTALSRAMQGFSTFFNISTTTAYQYYRVTIPEVDDGLLTGIRYMQLYIYDT